MTTPEPAAEGGRLQLPRVARDFRPWTSTSLNALTREVTARRAAGATLIDLVGGGAYENGLGFPNPRLRQIAEMAAQTSACYRPDPRGQPAARAAIADFYGRRGVHVDPSHVVLTPGTSVAYMYVMRLLASAGDEVLVPYPGYPLFEDLAVFCGVKVRRYHLQVRDGGAWRLDLTDLAFQITPRTRIVFLVSPHNPLGTVLSVEEVAAVGELCREHALALVFDEVFSEFAHLHPLPRPCRGPLRIVLNGLSKMLSLPGLKLGWMAVAGDEAAVTPFLNALEYAADLFLPVSELGQAMLAPLMNDADAVIASIAQEIRSRRAGVEARLDTVPADGGVYVCVPLPAGLDEDDAVMQLLDRGVLVHPGHFYGLSSHLVFTVLAQPSALDAGVGHILEILKDAGGISA